MAVRSSATTEDLAEASFRMVLGLISRHEMASAQLGGLLQLEDRVEEAVDIYKTYGVFDYITSFYDILHSTGKQYIVEDIDIYLNARR